MSTINISTTTHQPNLVSVTSSTDVVLSINVNTEEPAIVITTESMGPQGPVGPANTLTIGTVQIGPIADAEITGGAPNQTLNLTLPTRQDPRHITIVSDAAPTPDSDITDIFTVTALATNAIFGIPAGTPVTGQKLILRIKDNGTARTLAFNSIYRAIGVTLPTTTVNNKTIYLGMFYNSDDSKWDVVAYVIEG